MNVRKYTFPDRDGVDKGPHISVCNTWRGLVVVVGCDGNGVLESFPKTLLKGIVSIYEEE